MKEIPMIFQGWGVRAILEGRKTQTRRVFKPLPEFRGGRGDINDPGCWGWEDEYGDHISIVEAGKARPGDRIWVREAFRLRADQDRKPPSQDWWKSGAWYQADDPELEPSGCGGGAGKLRPSIHMPRWASRITLPLTGVRVERVQDISEEDARAEGINREHTDMGVLYWLTKPSDWSKNHKDVFSEAWNTINAKRPGCAWADNPWVVVYEWAPYQQEGK